MQLNEYLNLTGQSAREFAEQTGYSYYAVVKWRQGTRVPRAMAQAKIKFATGGRVTGDDWLPILTRRERPTKRGRPAPPAS